MKKETNPKAKRNGLWCNVLIVAALLLIVAVLVFLFAGRSKKNIAGRGCRAGSHGRPRSHRHPRPVAGESIPRRHRR